jgi:hypothetical protein
VKNKNLLLALLCLTGGLYAQDIQVGFMPVVNMGVYQHGRSHYNHDDIKGGLTFGGGVWLPVRLAAGSRVALVTGLGWQRKSFKATHSIEAPGVSGTVRVSRNFSCLELPLIGAYTSGAGNTRVEYQAGLVMSYNMPTAESMGFTVEGTEPGGSGVWLLPSNWEKTPSPDVFAGISLVHYREQARRWQMTMAFQYGLLSTSRMNLYADVYSATGARYYLNFLRPALSILSLSFTVWPKWLNFTSSADKATQK